MGVTYLLREILRCKSILEQRQFTSSLLSSNTEKKRTLTSQSYGGGTGSCITAIHETQGLTYESVIVIKRKGKLKSHRDFHLLCR